MKTVDDLYSRYKSKHVLLKLVATEFFGIKTDGAFKTAVSRGKFKELSPFKLSPNAPWLVTIDNLAAYIDKKQEAA